MIVKEKNSPKTTDPMGIAGYEAEKQTAFFLRRAFAETPDVLVFNDVVFDRGAEPRALRLEITAVHKPRLGLAEGFRINSRATDPRLLPPSVATWLDLYSAMSVQ